VLHLFTYCYFDKKTPFQPKCLKKKKKIPHYLNFHFLAIRIFPCPFLFFAHFLISFKDFIHATLYTHTHTHTHIHMPPHTIFFACVVLVLHVR
jgi:hypothetical protein